MLRVIARLRELLPIEIEATYLGAHVVPEGVPRADYVQEVLASLPEAWAAGAQWCDVFCDEGVFTLDETRLIMERAKDSGTGPSPSCRGDRAHRSSWPRRRARLRQRRPPGTRHDR